MSKEKPVYFPIGNSGPDDFRHGMNLLRVVSAAMSAMHDRHMAVDLGALQASTNDAIAYLEGALAWATRVEAEEADHQYAACEGRQAGAASGKGATQ
ncbi:hypothetical protein FHS55_001590 [Angulomicrobium tetraedrale]|uniref:DUF3077 domain-containing protein n=1 Tax=Ancylobacter tetraedralis TaxID=217068 RepID=A0A839Z928_9HYPH|nr:hypothetical protein [Ancylobacter tetraedralis]MBB3770995.1 hypothetical protein [Ancylobacter tetraedralis]